MGVIERLDLFMESLPRTCLYCVYGYPVVFGIDSFLDCFACGAHVLEEPRGKRVTLRLTTKAPGEYKRPYAPLVKPDEACADFRPVRFDKVADGRRKFRLLDEFGYFDEREDD